MSKDARCYDKKEKLHYTIMFHISRNMLGRVPNEMTVSFVAHANK